MTGGGLLFLGASLIVAAFIIMSVRIYRERPDFVIKLLKYALIIAFAFVFSIASIAIGFRIDQRHSSTYSRSLKSVQQIWGGQVTQQPPFFSYTSTVREQYEDKKTGQLKYRTRQVQSSLGYHTQKTETVISKNLREKGLLVFPGYLLTFTGEYTMENSLNRTEDLSFNFPLPEGAGNISAITVTLDGKKYTGDSNLANGIQWGARMKPGEKHVIRVSYSAQGTASFTYALGNRKTEIKNLVAMLTTDFTDTVIPDGAMVPTSEKHSEVGKTLTWMGNNLVTGQNIALSLNISGNYGALISKMFFYSPLAIFLFLGYLVIFTVARQITLHPMHYLFILTGFFIYYLLGSYMMSYMGIIGAIVLSLVISTAIVLYYTVLINKGREVIWGTAFGLIIFQWIFSVAFFFPEHTGFTITIATVIAFIALMRATASIDWENKW